MAELNEVLRHTRSHPFPRGIVFYVEHCAVADGPLAAGTVHHQYVVTVDIKKSPPGSSRHQTAPNNAKILLVTPTKDNRALSTDVEARARQERERGARRKCEHTDLRIEPSDPPSSPSAALRQKEAVRRLRKMYCERTDGFDVLGARYKMVWGIPP